MTITDEERREVARKLREIEWRTMPEPADSWEKLEKDAMKCACDILGMANLQCRDCEWAKNGVGCQAGARLEILKRAKKLARHTLPVCGR